ncbi:hypothetical protein BV133_679 [Blastochloris viridis]|uniref:Uncharacterized protein n=1 Tax=Blastochloris viridis TaxID=1079 RepID=A0A182D0F6_BLAVI|nr:hypothetical protein BV133_679 [Blastochloris viridis]
MRTDKSDVGCRPSRIHHFPAKPFPFHRGRLPSRGSGPADAANAVHHKSGSNRAARASSGASNGMRHVVDDLRHRKPWPRAHHSRWDKPQ